MKRLVWLTVTVVFFVPSLMLAITYDEALRTAFLMNPGLGIADLGVSESEEQLIQARSSFSPQIKFQGSYTRLGTVPIIHFEVAPGVAFDVPMGEADNYSAGFSISVPIFLGGKRAWALEMTRLGVDAAQEDAVIKRAELHSQVTAAFYGLMLAEEAEKISRETLKKSEAQLEQTRARWKVGYASGLDLKQDEVAVSQAKAALVEAQNSRLQTQQFLNMVIGRPLEDSIGAEGDFTVAYQEMRVDTLVKRALSLRPEISALDRAQRIAELSRNLARSSYSPSLVFVTSPTWQNPYQQQEGWGSSMSATVALEWPLFDGGKGLSQARTADIQLKKLALSRSQAEQGIELEVRQAYASWQEANQRLLVQQTLEEQMIELASMAEEQYSMGVISSLDYQSIKLAKTQAELAKLASLYQLILANEKLQSSAWLWDEESLEKFQITSVKED